MERPPASQPDGFVFPAIEGSPLPPSPPSADAACKLPDSGLEPQTPSNERGREEAADDTSPPQESLSGPSDDGDPAKVPDDNSAPAPDDLDAGIAGEDLEAESVGDAEIVKESAAPPVAAAGVPEKKAAAGGGSSSQQQLPAPDPRTHLNVVFIGHVDAGKSTTCGNILVLTGQVDERSMEKYEREAKEKGRDSWFLAYILDCNEEEREKGKTVEVARAGFALTKNRFTVLDAPGHRAFVPAMIAGAAQADVAVLLVSARKGEFEAGFDKGGQTKEHALLARTLGVTHVVVAVNKMDEKSVSWSRERYDAIEKKVGPFLRSCGYAPTNVHFVPISGFTGQNLRVPARDAAVWGAEAAGEAAWWQGPTLFELLDSLSPPERKEDAAVRVPLLEGFRDGGVFTTGKVEQGIVKPRTEGVLMPGGQRVKVAGVLVGESEVRHAMPGENVTLRVSGVEESDIGRGAVLCPVGSPCSVATKLRVQLIVVDLLETRPLLTAGYGCVLHCHTATEEAVVSTLLESVDRATKVKKKRPPFAKVNAVVVCDLELCGSLACEPFNICPQLGRFSLRDEGRTIAIGKILEITA